MHFFKKLSAAIQFPDHVKVMGIAGLVVIISISAPLHSTSQELGSFDCDGTIYFSINDQSAFTQLATLDFDNMTFNFIGSPLPRFNGMGLNPVDGLIYATVPSTSEIYRIDSGGNLSSVGLASGALPSGGGWVSGGFLPDGRFVINQANDGAIVIISDLEIGRPVVESSVTYGVGNYIDIVFNPADGLMYSYEKRNEMRLTTIDPFTGETNHVGLSNASILPGTGGMAFNSSGELITIGASSDESSDRFALYNFNVDTTSDEFGLSHFMGVTDQIQTGVDATSCYF